MSYVSGFMMGAAIGKSIRQMCGGASAAAPSDNPAVGRRGRAANLPRQATAVGGAPSFALVSTLPGRRRYRAARIAPAIASALEEHLSSLDFIKDIQVNALSGSILITFDEADCLRVDALAAGSRSISSLSRHPLRRPVPGSMSRMPAGSRAACAIPAARSRPGSTATRLAGST